MRGRAFPETLILAVFIAGAALLSSASWFAVSSGRAFLESGARIDRLHEADRALTSLMLSVRSAESGQRGYIVTGREEYLDSYRQAQSAAQRHFADSWRLLADGAGIGREIDTLDGQVRQKLDELRQTAELRAVQGFDAAQRAVATGDGRTLTLGIQSRADRLEQAISREIAEETLRSVEHRASAVRGITLVAALLVALLGAAYVVIAWELHECRGLLLRLEQEATHDPLTQLPNRRFFADWLSYALAQARRDDAHLGLLFIDIDGFKSVNDRRGRKAGDAVLAEIATRFRETARDSDVLARLGGDKFALAVPGTRDGREIAALAQRLIASLRDPQRPPLSDEPIGASIGVAFFPDDAGDIAGLIAAADDAMYVAKRGGRNRAVFSAVAAVA